jgi:hypothetical protein
MRLAWVALALACFCAAAQTPASQNDSGTPGWRSTLMGWPERASANTNIQEINRFIENVQLAGPYFATLTPGDYEANRELMRRLWAYMATLELLARDPQMRLAVGRARGALSGLRFGIMVAPGPPRENSSPAPVAAPAPPAEPPFAKEPDGVDVPEDLRTRYDLALGRATTAWYSIETLRQSLAARGYSLNTQTAAALGRIQLDFDMAARSLKGRDWTETATYLERAEYETTKVLKTVGQ